MLLSLILLALQEPAPQAEVKPNPQDDSVSMQEVQAKLADVATHFAEADARLRETVAQFDDIVMDAAVEIKTQPILLHDAAVASQLLVDEMNTLLEMLPAPPPPKGGGQGQNASSGRGQGDPGEGEDEVDGNADKPGNKPSQSRPQPSHQESNQGQSSLLEQPLRDFLRDPRDGQWGKLPPRLQQAIDTASAEDVPLRYRRWLVEYHRQDQTKADGQ